jgi:hypothetical protein
MTLLSEIPLEALRNAQGNPWNITSPPLVPSHHLTGKRNRGPEVGTGIGSSAINRLARSARALASFASYTDQLLSHTEIVSCGPERYSDLGKAETS